MPKRAADEAAGGQSKKSRDATVASAAGTNAETDLTSSNTKPSSRGAGAAKGVAEKTSGEVAKSDNSVANSDNDDDDNDAAAVDGDNDGLPVDPADPGGKIDPTKCTSDPYPYPLLPHPCRTCAEVCLVRCIHPISFHDILSVALCLTPQPGIRADTRRTRPSPRPSGGKADVFVSPGRPLAPVLKRLTTLLFTDNLTSVVVHGMGPGGVFAAVKAAVDVTDKHQPWVKTSTTTDTNIVVDDYIVRHNYRHIPTHISRQFITNSRFLP